MEQFTDRIAVVTGGGTGMGRELVRQLSAEGCHVALCDVNEETMAETVALAEKEAPSGTRFTTFSVPREAMARRATQMLCERIEANSKGEQVLLPCEPVEGDTLGSIHPETDLK